MFGRLRKNSSVAPDHTEEISSTAPEEEEKVGKELEVEFNPTGNEIDQARQDLMRAAMEAIAMPAAEPGSTASAATMVKDEVIPVIQVKVNRPEPKTPPPSKSETQSKPPAPKPRLAPTPPAKIAELPTKIKSTEPTKSPEPVITKPPEPEPTVAPGEEKTRETVSVNVDPKAVEAIPTKIDTPSEVVPLRTEPKVVEPKLPPPDRIAEPQIEEEEDVSEQEIIAQIAPGAETLSSRIMTYVDTEPPVEPLEVPSEEMALKSPASEISSALPPRRSELPIIPHIAQLDDIMTDIVKQDITSHRKRLAQ